MASGRLDANDKLARIGAREVGFANQGIQPEAQQENSRDAEHCGQRTHQGQAQRALVAIQHPVEMMVEPFVETPPPTLVRVVITADATLAGRGVVGLGRERRNGVFWFHRLAMIRFDQLGAEQRHHRQGDKIGGEQ